MEPTYTDPHNCEGHTKAHKDTFDALMERLKQATVRLPKEPESSPAIGSSTFESYPRLTGFDRSPDR